MNLEGESGERRNVEVELKLELGFGGQWARRRRRGFPADGRVERGPELAEQAKRGSRRSRSWRSSRRRDACIRPGEVGEPLRREGRTRRI